MESDHLEQPNIHDNFVYAYAVLIDRRQLILHTQYRDVEPGELTDIIFSGVVAHYFQDVGYDNILLDIEEVEPEFIVHQQAELLSRRKNYGWPPLEYNSPADLIARLKEQRVRGYLVMGSAGLDGFVLACRVSYVTRTEGKAFERPHPPSPQPT
jgi:hypothetical protein